VDQLGAVLAEGTGDLDALVHADPAAGPVGHGQAGTEQPIVRPHRAHVVEHLKREAQPVVERAPVPVVSPVCQRRQETGEEITVRHVELERVEAGDGRMRRCRGERLTHPCHVFTVGGLRLGAEGPVAQRRGGQQWPATGPQREIDTAPARLGPTSPAGVSKLEHDESPRAMHLLDDRHPLVGVERWAVR
jgi:hypothetical protein